MFFLSPISTIFALSNRQSCLWWRHTILQNIDTMDKSKQYIFFIFWMLRFESSEADAFSFFFQITPRSMSFQHFIQTVFNHIQRKLHQNWNVKMLQIKETREHQRAVRRFSQKNPFPIIMKFINAAALVLMIYQMTIHVIYL